MAGAAGLVGASAASGRGAGLVQVASPVDVQPTVAHYEPSYMTYPLPQDDEGFVDFAEARPALERLARPATVLAVGPGLGQADGIKALVRWVVESVQVPTVLDADALNAPGWQPRLLGLEAAPGHHAAPGRVLGQLVGKTTARGVQADRESLAANLAREHRIVVVLKGNGTIVTDGERVYVNTSGNPGMATGGAGDVLTGVTAAMLGQKLPAFEAACLATYAHGLAGDIARDQNGEVGMIAGDIVDALADTFSHLDA